jgi:hypothetical protein
MHSVAHFVLIEIRTHNISGDRHLYKMERGDSEFSKWRRRRYFGA